MIFRFLLFVFSCSFAMAGPWEDFVASHRAQAAGKGQWTLCVKPGLLAPGALLADTDYQRLATGGDFGLEVLATGPAHDLEANQGAQWALLAPSGDVAGVGKGRPRGTAVLDAIHATGALARWEARDAFLKENPGQGEARQEALGHELRLLRYRLAALDAQGKVRVPAWHAESGRSPGPERITLAGADGDSRAGELYGPVGEALAALAKVNHWYRDPSWLAARLAQVDLGQSGSLRALFRDLAGEIGERARANPEDAALAGLWTEILDGAGLATGGLPGGPRAVPGTVWPPAQVLDQLLEPYRRRRDLDGELRLLEELAPHGPPVPFTAKGWEDYCQLQAGVLANRAAALAASGALDQARSALDAAAEWGGARTFQAALLRRGLPGDPGGDALRRLLVQAGTARTRRPAPPQAPAPLRLVLLGRPAWLLAWTGLRDSPQMALWSSGELRWEIAAPEAHARWRGQFGWGPEARWVLFQGEEVLATGGTCPQAPGLAAVLAAHGTPYLERLARFIAEEPGHAGARRARFEALQGRMPDPRLEPLLVEDAVHAQLALPFAPGEAWKPDAALWGAAAQEVLPGLEAQLRAWPTDAGLWRTWISWARFHPGHPSILDLARGLPYWFPGGDWRTALPYGVQRAVAAELRRQGDFLQMRDWFQASWDVLDHRPLKDLRPWERGWLRERRLQEETAVFQPLRDALRGLGLHEQQVELEKAFGAMMGRDVSRSR